MVVGTLKLDAYFYVLPCPLFNMTGSYNDAAAILSGAQRASRAC